jgi:plasmid replication initiation protein
MPYLCELRANFTQVKLKLLSGLNSVYAQRLYELLVRFKSKKVYLTTVEDFRFAMSVPDVYLYGNIKQTCILPALLEIKEKLHLEIQLTEVKKLRKVVALQFRW